MGDSINTQLRINIRYVINMGSIIVVLLLLLLNSLLTTKHHMFIGVI